MNTFLKNTFVKWCWGASNQLFKKTGFLVARLRRYDSGSLSIQVYICSMQLLSSGTEQAFQPLRKWLKTGNTVSDGKLNGSHPLTILVALEEKWRQVLQVFIPDHNGWRKAAHIHISKTSQKNKRTRTLCFNYLLDKRYLLMCMSVPYHLITAATSMCIDIMEPLPSL